MRIAFLCKRQYMGKDVIVDRYARLYEIPAQLAAAGHDVHAFCLSYQGHEEGEWTHDGAPGSLSWESRSLGRWKLPVLAGYPRRLLERLRALSPDVVVGASDIPHVALAAWLARRLDMPYAIDLYDNFEGFGQARIPGMVGLLRRAVRDAGLVTTTSEPLRDLVVNDYKARGEVLAIPSTVDRAVFHAMDRSSSRCALGLPEHARLVGTAGGLHKDKGIDTLYEAWPRIARRHPDARLVLAGPFDPKYPPPQGERVHYLGMLPHARTAELFNALDVGVIYLRDTVFGRYCFPQKAYEMMACGLPLVSAAVGVMPGLLGDASQGLFEADDPAGLDAAVDAQFSNPAVVHVDIADWKALVGKMELRLRSLVSD